LAKSEEKRENLPLKKFFFDRHVCRYKYLNFIDICSFE